MYKVIKWLGQERIDLFVEGGAWMIPIRRDYETYIFIGLVNLETDSWGKISFTLYAEREIKQVKRVQLDGSWKICDAAINKLDDSNIKIDIKEGLEYMDFAAFVLEHQE